MLRIRKVVAFLLIFSVLSRPSLAGIDFDGDTSTPGRWSDYLLPTDIVLTGSFAIAAWVRQDVNPASGQNHGIIMRDSAINFYHNYYLIKTNSGGTGTWKCGFRDSTGSAWREITSTTSGGTGSFVHVGCNFNSSTGRLDLYVNGASVANGTWAGATPNNDGTLSIGSFHEEQFSTYGGVIEEAVIYNASLTGQDWANLASRVRWMPLQISPSSLQLYLPLADGPDGTSADGDTIRDYSQNNYTVTAVDGADNTGLTWTAGRISYP